MRGWRPFCRSSFRFKPSALPRHLLYFPIIPRWAGALFAAHAVLRSQAPSPAKSLVRPIIPRGAFAPFIRSLQSGHFITAPASSVAVLPCAPLRGWRPFCRSVFRFNSCSPARHRLHFPVIPSHARNLLTPSWPRLRHAAQVKRPFLLLPSIHFLSPPSDEEGGRRSLPVGETLP